MPGRWPEGLFGPFPGILKQDHRPGLIFLVRPAKVLGVLKGPDGKQTFRAPRGDRGRDTRINVHSVPDSSTLPQPKP